MVYFTILLFFVYTFCLGFTASSFVKNSDNFLERNLMRIGFGLALLPFLALALNLIKVPADWRILLALSLIYPIYFIIRNFSKFDFSQYLKLKLTKTNISIIVMLLIFAATFYIYASGAFKYPYLEDDDSWGHSQGVKFVSIGKTVFTEQKGGHRYLNPYPPTYDLLLGILHQTNNSVYWTLKFFNALIISLSIIFFYFFIKELIGSSNKALFATFALASIPSFLSHFIWAISLSVPLYFASFYCVERIKYDNKWWIVAGLIMVTTLTSSPTHSTYFGFLFVLYVLTKMIAERKFLLFHILAGFLGILLSFIFWWLPMIFKYGLTGTITGLGFRLVSLQSGAFAVGGTGDRVYNFADFFIAQKENMINNPIGIGIFLFVVMLIGIFSIYFYFFNNSKKFKEHSKNKFYIVGSIQAISITLLVIGLLLFAGTGKFQPGTKQENAKLADSIRLALFFIFSSLLIFLLLGFYIARNIEENYRWILLALVWFVFTLYAVNGALYPIKLSAFRAWMLLAIPVSILATEGTFFILSFFKGFKMFKIIVFIVIITGIYFTSAQQKIAVNTALWPPGGFWTSNEELNGYLWMKENIGQNEKVFGFVVDGPIIGLDKFICYWCQDVKEFKKNGFNRTASEINSFLKSRGYKYLIMDGQVAKEYGINETNNKLNELLGSNLFNPVQGTQGFVLLQVL